MGAVCGRDVGVFASRPLPKRVVLERAQGERPSTEDMTERVDGRGSGWWVLKGVFQ